MHGQREPDDHDTRSDRVLGPRHAVDGQRRAHHVRRVLHPGRRGPLDIELPHAGEPKIRAVTGLWDHQAVAVLANDPKGCGVWALGLARGLSPEATAQIQQEVADGVKNFGVTASPVPREP